MLEIVSLRALVASCPFVEVKRPPGSWNLSSQNSSADETPLPVSFPAPGTRQRTKGRRVRFVHVFAQEPVPLHGFNQSLQFAHRSLRLQDQAGKIFGLVANGIADCRQIGAGELARCHWPCWRFVNVTCSSSIESVRLREQGLAPRRQPQDRSGACPPCLCPAEGRPRCRPRAR